MTVLDSPDWNPGSLGPAANVFFQDLIGTGPTLAALFPPAANEACRLFSASCEVVHNQVTASSRTRIVTGPTSVVTAVLLSATVDGILNAGNAEQADSSFGWFGGLLLPVGWGVWAVLATSSGTATGHASITYATANA